MTKNKEADFSTYLPVRSEKCKGLKLKFKIRNMDFRIKFTYTKLETYDSWMLLL